MLTEQQWAEIRAAFAEAGVPEYIWLPIMWLESRFNPRAVNDTRGRTDLRAGTVPELSIGLFQFNLLARFPDAPQAELDRLIAQYQDPVFNARQAAARLGATLAAAPAILTEISDDALKAGFTATRSGWPGGSLQYPCRSEWCQEYDRRLTAAARSFLAGGLQALTGGNTGALAGAGASAAAGAAAAAGLPQASGAASGAASAASGLLLLDTVQERLSRALARVDWGRVAAGGAGAVLVLIGVYGLTQETARAKVSQVIRLARDAGEIIPGA